MIPKTGNISFRSVLTDCGVSTMYGNGYMTQNSIRDRKKTTTSGSFAMTDLRGSITSCHRVGNTMWGATNYTSGQANCAQYMTPGNKECSWAVNSLRIGASRQSAPDQWVESHYHGYTSGRSTLQLEGTIKGFGSANAKEAPGQISVLVARTGWLNGDVQLLHNFQYYGTFSDRPIGMAMNCPTDKTFVSVVCYQLLYGPDHSPSSDGQAPIGTKYLTAFADIRIKS